MKKIFIKYNPFTLETIVKADGKNLNEESNSLFNKRQRLQEYNLIEKLDKELNYNGNYHIVFHGTRLDYEDISEYTKEAKKKLENRNIQLEHIESREVKDRKKEIENIFYEIQNNSYSLENLKSNDLRARFEEILNSEFEINVVATMSSGKSTLINSLLSRKILPSSNEACTATITRIKDIDNDNFIGKAYYEKGKLKYEEDNISYEKMIEWNKAEDILTIELQGNIPFVEASEISLVMTDTPGPNNSKDKSHRQRLMNMLDGNKYKPLILYVLNATQFGITDDSELLKSIIKKLENADKQTKDSFLFVVNKIDTFNEDDNIQKTLENIKTYLEKKGIIEPNILPVAALPALEIRSEPRSPIEQMRRKQAIELMNIDENLYLENYIILPPKDRQEIKNELELAKKDSNVEINQEKIALIHTGIPSLEKIIKAYIEKYALAIKIKDLIDLFRGPVNSELNFIKKSKEINEMTDVKKILELEKQIENIKYEISDLEKFDNYNKQIRQKSRSVDENLEKKIKEIREKMKGKVTELKNEISEEIIENTIKVEEAKKHHDKVIEVGKNIEIELKNELQNTIQKSLIETLEGLYKEYVNRIKKLTLTENKIINEEILINPFEMIEGSIESFKSFDEFRTEYSEIKNEIIGTKEVENEREWWEFWRWLEPSTVIIDVYGDVEYVNMNDFLENYHNDIESLVFKITDKALQYGKAEISKIEEQFIKTKEQLDNILKNKLEYISELIQNKKNTSTDIEKKFKEFDEKIKWLESIKKRIEEVIEI